MKFQSQCKDPVNGSDLVHSSFGPNAERRHKHFKAFLSLLAPSDAAHPPRLRSEQPNYKVDTLLNHMNRVNQSAWLLGRNNAVDEQTIGFQGRHADKL
jgi:hypothetical protein